MGLDPGSLAFHGLWMLSAMGAAALSSVAVPVAPRLFGVAIGFAASFLLTPSGPAQIAALAALTAAIALAQLLRPRRIAPGLMALMAMIGAGALGGVWSALVAAQGLPRSVSAAAAVALLAGVATLAARRPTFAPEVLRDESLLIVLALALAVATAPAIASGWQAAASLNVAQPAQAVVLPAWTLVTVVGTCAIGGLCTWWVRR